MGRAVILAVTLWAFVLAVLAGMPLPGQGATSADRAAPAAR